MSGAEGEPAQPVVLAADDDEDILELVAFRLERSGYTVLRAHDGEEALRLAREEQPDLGVLDVMMPKLDGFEVTRRLRADAATSSTPIILLTARAQDADHSPVERGVLLGMSAEWPPRRNANRARRVAKDRPSKLSRSIESSIRAAAF